MTVAVIIVVLAAWLFVAVVVARVCGGDTTRRQHEAVHRAAYEKRLRALRDEAGLT